MLKLFKLVAQEEFVSR